MTYIKENTNMNEHRRVIIKTQYQKYPKSAYRERSEAKSCPIKVSEMGEKNIPVKNVYTGYTRFLQECFFLPFLKLS